MARCYMERKITQKLMEWKSDPERRPLIITGCRQIGKTFSIKEFVSSEYRNYMYINFEIQPGRICSRETAVRMN